ncbi:hypothetical protein CDAR_423051 [Caerostris darwini]|uniref:Uncharacterized protein n=1 Tax=Caerostris darwini TaxID=1538125 RepID=A0AAV4TGQ3_9ARAC|nr:hypothetical protein CDAR_423051 [Caerostris darwini]
MEMKSGESEIQWGQRAEVTDHQSRGGRKLMPCVRREIESKYFNYSEGNLNEYPFQFESFHFLDLTSFTRMRKKLIDRHSNQNPTLCVLPTPRNPPINARRLSLKLHPPSGIELRQKTKFLDFRGCSSEENRSCLSRNRGPF